MKVKIDKTQIFNQAASVKWVAAGISFLVILILIGGIWVWPQNNLLLSIFLGVAIAGVVYFIAGRFIQLQAELINMQNRIAVIEEEADNANRRLEAVFKLGRKFVESKDENEVISSMLATSVDLVGAVGASLVPIDERGQPMTAISYGELPDQVMDAWVEYLASPSIRHSCGTCQKTGSFVQSCQLVEIPALKNQLDSDPSSVYCLPLRRGDHEFGVMNLYLSDSHSLDADAQDFLLALLDETALALESIRLQNREIFMLQQMQAVRRSTDIEGMELNFLENIKNTLEADFVLLQPQESHESNPDQILVGDIPESGSTLVDGLIQGVIKSGKPVLLGDVEGYPGGHQSIHSLLAVPVTTPGTASHGVILAGNVSYHKFNTRHLMLLQTLAGQVNKISQNAGLIAELEFNAIISERTRLAREIHDGLAQTLGFLKLQAAQMENLLVTHDTDRLQERLTTTYKVLSDAYNDVRQAIDGLRISPNGDGLTTWLRETCLEFEENTGLPVSLKESSVEAKLPLEVQAQLIRIVQEALSNVRKHSGATRAWINCNHTENGFMIEIGDDGCGFSLEEVPGVSRYGLQGMRERSDLIGGEIEVISGKGEGTIIRVNLPKYMVRMNSG